MLMGIGFLVLAPIKNQAGEVTGILEVDYKVEKIH